jgi:hypothetical protein
VHTSPLPTGPVGTWWGTAFHLEPEDFGPNVDFVILYLCDLCLSCCTMGSLTSVMFLENYSPSGSSVSSSVHQGLLLSLEL